MSDIDEVKSRLNIVDIVSQRVTIKKTGRNFKGLCPFHNEKTPSFIVSPDRQSFKCFGCGKGGSVIDFVMEYEHVDFAEALETLAEKAGVKLTRRAPESAEGRLKTRILEANHLASEFYQYLLHTHALGETARLYLKSRGVSDKAMQTFGLGYSPNSWDALIKFLRKKGYDEVLMEKAGLVVKSSKSGRGSGYYDRFRGRVMFALKDHRGQVVGFSGRVLDNSESEAKYINTAETPVYIKGNMLYGLDVTKDAIQKANEAIIMEGELDVISAFQAGIANVVAIKGSALTDAHVRLIRRFAERIAFALDSDVAGDKAARRGIEIADSAGLDMRVVLLPSGKDPDEVARENPVALKSAIKKAIPIYDYFLLSAQKRYDGTTAFGKRKISEEVLSAYAKIENPIVRGHYAKKLASVLDVSEDAIQEGILKQQREQKSGFASKTAIGQGGEKENRTRPEKLELYVLALLLQKEPDQHIDELTAEIPVSQFRQAAVRTILTRLQETVASGTTFLLKDFLDSLPPELGSTLDEALLFDLGDMLDNEEAYSAEWYNAIGEAKKLLLRAEIAKLTADMKKGGLSADKSGKIAHKVKSLTDALRSLEKGSAI